MNFLKGCAVKHGEYLCRGNTTAASIEKTAEHCARQCYNTPTCVAWTFGSTRTTDDRPTPYNCWLKTTAECKGSNPDWMWGPRKCGNLTGSLTSESVISGGICFKFCLFTLLFSVSTPDCCTNFTGKMQEYFTRFGY